LNRGARRAPTCGLDHTGFTLVEILVVVGIIALLISILLPSLRAARRQAQATICGTHLEQIFAGIFMYTQANQDVLPHLGWRADKDRMLYAWFTQIAPHIRRQFGIYRCPGDDAPDKEAVFVKNGTVRLAAATEPATTLLLTYRGSCDSLDDGRQWLIGTPGFPAAQLYPMPRKLTNYDRPGTAMLMVEGFIAGRPEPCFRFDQLSHLLEKRVPVAGDPQSIASFGRHTGRSNVLFADGHVGRHTVWDLYNHLPYQQQFTSKTNMRTIGK
jgi:prepilin-type processing-associated H-X9-DG protein/prepilin-type N-terminal cleavage/methylation domain-containing protein